MIVFRRRHALKLGLHALRVDNVVLNSGTGGVTAATDDVAGVHYQRVKLVDGTLEGTAAIPGDATNGLDVDVTRVIPGTTATALGKAEDDASASADTGVVVLTVRQDTPAGSTSLDLDYQPLKTDSVGRVWVNASGAAVPVTDNSGSLTVDNATLSVVGSGAEATALRVTIASDSTGVLSVDDNGGSLTVDGSVSISGTPNVAVTSVVPGTAATNLGKAEDDAAASGDVGVALLTRRQDALVTDTSLDGDYNFGKSTAAGRLYTSATVDAALPAGTNNIGDVDVLTLPALVAGTANIGDVDVLTLPALPAGTNNIGDVDVLTLPALVAGTANIGDVDIVTMPNVTLAAGTNTNEVVGDAAHDAAIAGNPMRIAGRAITADYTSVAAGDTADLVATLNGKLVTQPFSIPELTWSSAAAAGGIVNTTGVTARAAAGVGIRNYITGLDVVNGHATVSTDVQIRDGAAGTVLWRGFAQAAGGGVSRQFNPPLRGTANTLVEIACGTTGTATYFNLSGYQGP